MYNGNELKLCSPVETFSQDPDIAKKSDKMKKVRQD